MSAFRFDPPVMSASVINTFVGHFESAFAGLGRSVPLDEIEMLATLVHHSMESGRRRYHNSAHVFDMCVGMNPLQTLAALFHDVVYVQLDQGFPAKATDLLEAVVSLHGGQYVLLPVAESDSGLRLCRDVFGFTEGTPLPLYGGLNEFLSALVAVRKLSPYLNPAELLAIVAAIEATVPFRGHDTAGQTVAAGLARRLRSTAETQGFSLAATQLDQMLEDAFVLANRDVAGFAVEDPARFLSATWMLIEESNAPLALIGVYSIQDYRQALLRMDVFLDSLDAERIFHGYGRVCPPEVRADLVRAARANLDFAVRYIDAKLGAIAVLEALALESGGDAPISMLLGDIQAAHCRPERVDDFLSMPTVGAPDLDPVMRSLLEEGRPGDVRSDMSASPLTAFLYRYLGEAGMAGCAHRAKQMFAGEISPRTFLDSLPAAPVREILEACARISPTRRARLHTLATLMATNDTQASAR